MGIGIGNTNNSTTMVNNYFGGSPMGQMGGMMPQNPMMQLMQMMQGLTGGPCQEMMGGMMPGMMGGMMPGMMGGMMPGMEGMGGMMGNCVGNFMGMQQNPMMQMMQMMMQMMQMMMMMMGGGANPFMGGMMPGMMGGMPGMGGGMMPGMGGGMMPGMGGGGAGAYAGIGPNGQPYAGAYAGANGAGAMAGAGGGNPVSGQYANIINQEAMKNGVDPALVKAIIKNESGFNPQATSHCGAQGLMQLMPATARGLGVQNAYDPGQNIMGGAKYIGQLMKQFGGDMKLAVAAYNAGPGNVKKYGGVPPFKETQNYVVKVMASYQEYKAQG